MLTRHIISFLKSEIISLMHHEKTVLPLGTIRCCFEDHPDGRLEINHAPGKGLFAPGTMIGGGNGWKAERLEASLETWAGDLAGPLVSVLTLLNRPDPSLDVGFQG